ncbi:hypothetical protein GHT09_017344 [Marmota monax]|uniref:Uncharacterized protein n=1 Tax=Marmota monax TaxID=9995 RepID=A0A834Q8W9_MARMO|nr:hypothetical protein GHT09_017344 [Marmota monax]
MCGRCEAPAPSASPLLLWAEGLLPVSQEKTSGTSEEQRREPHPGPASFHGTSQLATLLGAKGVRAGWVPRRVPSGLPEQRRCPRIHLTSQMMRLHGARGHHGCSSHQGNLRGEML